MATRVLKENVKTVEELQKHSIQSRADDDSGIGLGGGAGGGLLTYMVQSGELVSPWWSTKRDVELRKFVKMSDHLSGSLSLLTSKVINVPVEVQPRDMSLKSHIRQADEYNRRLQEESEFGQTWISLLSKWLADFWTTDAPACMEVIGAGKPDGPIKGPALGLAHLDSTKIVLKKDSEFPIAYIDEDGHQYKLHRTRVAYAADMPSAAVEMRGIGFCAISRAINTGQNMVDMSIFRQEKLGSRPFRGIMFTPGIPTDVVQSTMEMASEMMDNQGLRRFAKIPILGGGDTSARFELVGLSSLPDGFDEETSTRLGMFAIALAFGVPIRWIWPAATSGATKADAMYQHIAGLGGGIGRVLKTLTYLLGGDPRGAKHTVGKFLPPHLKLAFDFQDDEQDRMKSEIAERRMGTLEKGIGVGLYTLRVAREKALEAGDISQAQFSQMELAEGRLPSGEDVLTLFYAGDDVTKQMLDLGVQDALDVAGNDVGQMLAAIEDRMAQVRDVISSAGSVKRKEVAKQAMAALNKLRDTYQEVAKKQPDAAEDKPSAQDDAADSEQDEQAQEGKTPTDSNVEQEPGVDEKEETEEEEESEEETEGKKGKESDGGMGILERAGRQVSETVGGLKGGPGSGHHGHSGVPGKQGGSTPGKASLPPQWGTSHHGDDGRINTDSITASVRKAIKENPDRAVHGYTATNGFFIVDDKIYPWNKYRDIPEDKQAQAIPVHSHGSDNWREFREETGKLEGFVPHDAPDIHLWLKDAARGRLAAASVLIMPDGRMEVLELLPSFDYAILKMGKKKLQELVEVPYAESLQAMTSDPSVTKCGLTRQKLAGFCEKYGIGYHCEGLSWGGLDEEETSKAIGLLERAGRRADGLVGRLKGGPGSGNFGHGGRPGKRGGSSSGGGIPNDLWKLSQDEWSQFRRSLTTEEGKPDLDRMTSAIQERERQIEESAVSVLKGQGWVDWPDVAEALGVEYARVGGALRRLERQGQVEKQEAQMGPGAPQKPSRYRLIGESDSEKGVGTSLKAWSSLADVPTHLRSLHDAPLTLGQANHLARIADSVEAEGQDTDIAWGTARNQFQRLYKQVGARWIKRADLPTQPPGKPSLLKKQLSRAASAITAAAERLGLKRPSPTQPDIHVHMPEQAAPVTHLDVRLPEQKQVASPPITIQPAQVQVEPHFEINVPERAVTVTTPDVHVDVPVNVQVPERTVNVAAPVVKAGDTVITVEAAPPAQVDVHATVDATLKQPDQVVETETLVERDPRTGRIVKTTKRTEAKE